MGNVIGQICLIGLIYAEKGCATMYIICEREHLQAVSRYKNHVELLLRTGDGWHTTFFTITDDAAQELADELWDVACELSGYLADLREARAASLEDEARAVRRGYRAFAGYGWGTRE